MAIPVDVVAVLTQCACVHTTPKETLVIAVCRCTTTSRGDMEKQTMPIHANCVTAMAMQNRATTMPRLTHFPIATIRGEVECVKTARETPVSFGNNTSCSFAGHFSYNYVSLM